MNDINYAWAAGFYEGEGTVGTYKTGITLQVNQQNKEPLEKLVEIFGGNITTTRQKSNGKEIHAWYVCGQDKVVHVIIKMMPYLSKRRVEQAWDALDRNYDRVQLRASMCRYRRHWRTAENTAIRSNGVKRCKDCTKEAWAKKRMS